MLNIKDIRERLKRTPEPKEIKDIRDNIINKFSNLEFIEEGHKYYLHKEDGTLKEMESVSNVCHMFEPYVDWEEILERKSIKIGIDKEELRRQWHENNIRSTSNGSLTHLFAEAYMYFFMGDIDSMPSIIKEMQYEDGFLIPYGEKQAAVAKYYEDLFKVDDFWAVMPEAKIYIDSEDNPYGIKKDISGTFDALFAYKGKDNQIKLSIRDWKTNKSLYNDYNMNNGNTLLHPFDTEEYINQPASIYTIQLSLYQLGIEQLGYKVHDRKLLWLTDSTEYFKIDVRDVRDKLIETLKQ